MNKVELGEEGRIRALEARTTTWLRVAVVQQVLLVGLLASAVAPAGGGKPAVAKNGLLSISADPNGQLLYVESELLKSYYIFGRSFLSLCHTGCIGTDRITLVVVAREAIRASSRTP